MQKNQKDRLFIIFVIIPGILTLIPFYNVANPTLFGIPFFYWFQTVWLVVLTGSYFTYAVITNRRTN